MYNNYRFLLLCVTFLFSISLAFGVTLPLVFGDQMVLQAGQSVPIWGWAKLGESITVTFAGQKKQTTVTAVDGRWEVRLDPLAVSELPRELIITGKETVTFKDVLVGEVWLCSGQSNMQKPLGKWRGQPITTINYEQELADANYPLIRLMKVKVSEKETPSNDLDTVQHPVQDYPWAGWVKCTPSSLDDIKFSAVGYFFAKKLFKELKTPIGVIEASAGGSHIEGWTPPFGFAMDTALSDFVKAAQTPKVSYKGTRITTLFNGMIYPIIPFAISGILWYQGESNLLKDDGAIYTNKMIALIKSWRAEWKKNLPFYFVQLPPLQYSTRVTQVHVPMAEPIFWEAQTAVLKLPNTGMVVTTDVGDLKNIHPPHKKEVGERLALWALAKTYKRKDVEPSGPFYRSVEFKGANAVLHFDHIGGGLISRDGQALNWFTIAGCECKYYPATASISGETVVVSCPQVTKPMYVRFAWDETANPNFFNKAGLPAVPFRTNNPLFQASDLKMMSK